jgi:Mrp family chromosome partitioning ATPase
VAEAGTIDFELARFEHLVETERGHIVRVGGTWSAPDPRELPHPTLLAGEGDDRLRLAPLPIPGQDPPCADGESPWLATYSLPKRLFDEGHPPACRLELGPDVVIDLPVLVVPAAGNAEGGRQVLVARPAASAVAAPDGLLPAAADETPAGPAEPAPAGKGVRDLFVPAMRSHRRLIAAVVALAVVASIIGLAVRSPTYRASAQLLVTPLPSKQDVLEGLPELRATSDPANAITTVAHLVKAHDTAQLAAARLGGGWTADGVLKRITTTPHGGSNVLEVEAEAATARESARIANTYARAAVDLRDRRIRQLAAAALANANAQRAGIADPNSADAQALDERIAALGRIQANGDPTVGLAQLASVPHSRDGLPIWAILVLSALAGGVLGVAAAALLDLVGPGRIDSEEDLAALYPLPVLTRLPRLPRRALATDAPALREALRTLQVQLELEPGRHRAVMVTSASTGDGKSTTSLAFAGELAAAGREVIVIDLDLRKPDLAGRLGVRPEHGLEHLVAERVPLADALVPVPGVPRLHLLAPAGETDLSTLEAVARHLPDIVEGATALADYVVLDTPPVGEVSDALTFARSVDDVLVVCRLGQTKRPSFETMRDVLERVGARPSGLVVIGGGGSTVTAKRSGAPAYAT